ncbi:MAG: glycosyltransferase [Fimbriimonadales bacterium]|nr:glycosyltransferase [Fimbriimonadales bacterium]
MGERLAFFSQSLGGGGAERVVVTLANEFVKRGYRVDVVNSYYQEGYQKLLAPEVNLIVLGVRRRLLAAPRLAKYLRQYRPSAMLATVNTIAAVSARLLARVPTRLVLREATTPSQELLHSNASLRAKLVRRWSLKWLYPRADCIIAVSKGVAQDIQRLAPAAADKIRIVYNPVISAELFQKADEQPPHRWFQNPESPIVLSIGRLVPLKGYDTLLRAFAQVRRQTPAQLVILGEGKERARLEQLATELGVRPFFDLPGFDPNPFRYMRQANVYVLSSRYEGLPNALIQAMALGCPVVSTDCPSGPNEILDGGKYGELVPVDDVDAMAQAVARVLQGQRKLAPPEWLDQFRAERVLEQYLEVMLAGAPL